MSYQNSKVLFLFLFCLVQLQGSCRQGQAVLLVRVWQASLYPVDSYLVSWTGTNRSQFSLSWWLFCFVLMDPGLRIDFSLISKLKQINNKQQNNLWNCWAVLMQVSFQSCFSGWPFQRRDWEVCKSGTWMLTPSATHSTSSPPHFLGWRFLSDLQVWYVLTNRHTSFLHWLIVPIQLSTQFDHHVVQQTL